jgi:ectoine hydroxylase-related dioxygenase (phytanoyl-CoA dioxygenase family)
MLKRIGGYLGVRDETPPASTETLHAQGFVVLADVLTPSEVVALRAEIAEIFDNAASDVRMAGRSAEADEMFRYAMLTRSALSQRALGHPRILETIEPLLGSDCHVIANTAWRNPPGHTGAREGQIWHIDAGPHVPRPPGTHWPDEIPYPVFAIGAHILLRDCNLEDGPTGAIPGSHRSGSIPPFDQLMNDDLDCEGERCVPLTGRAGDVALFVSDVWHRRLPAGEDDAGRFFLQVHYARRDIAQRLLTTEQANQLTPEAIARASTPRERTLIGLHPPAFYDG